MNMSTLAESTQAERHALLAAGMVELPRASWLAQVERLGYRVELAECFSYDNNSSPPNARRYKARCVSNYTHKATGLSFANVNAPRDANHRALQDMRQTAFCFVGGRIYEL